MSDTPQIVEPGDPEGPEAGVPETARGCAPQPEMPLKTRRDRLRAWADMLLSDHGLIRLFYLNRHKVSPKVWRAGQPSPGQLRAFARAGGRTVVSLRAGRGFGSLPLEVEACREAGLAFHVAPVRTHALPSVAELREFYNLFNTMERPALLHCKSGADRSGFAAALYLVLVEGRQVAEARKQLALRYGHNRHGRAGLLDAFFDAYQRDTAAAPMTLMEWVETAYDPNAIAAGFRPEAPGRRILRYLRRWR